MDSSYVQNSFLGGEWSQSMQGRFDRPDYRTAMVACRNGLPIETGAWTRRPGTRFVAPTRKGRPARLVKFDVKQTSPVMMEFTDGFVKFFRGANPVVSNAPKTVVSISTDTPALVRTSTAHGWTSGNVVAFSGFGLVAPRLHNRQFEIAVLDDSAFYILDGVTGQNINGAQLAWTAAAEQTVNKVIEITTHYTDDKWQTVRSVQAETVSVLVGSGIAPRRLALTNLPTAFLYPEFAYSTPELVDGPYSDPEDGDLRNVSATTSGTIRFNSDASYLPKTFDFRDIGRSIRLFSEPPVWASGSYTQGDIVAFADVYWTAQASGSLATPGTNTDWAPNPRAALWTWGVITGVADTSTIDVLIKGRPLQYLVPVRVWRLGVYGTRNGYPTCGTYHEGRLWLAGAIDNRVDATTIGGIRDDGKLEFTPTDAYGAVSDASGVSGVLRAPDVNPIYWMEPSQQGIICGTQAGEWLIQASALNNPITPTSFQAHRVTKIGCANILPCFTEHTLVFVQKHLRRLMEYFADVYSGKFSAPNLALTAKHLTQPSISEIAYQQDLMPVIWARRSDGKLVGASYKRDSLQSAQGPTFVGWHQHTLGSGRTVTGLAVGPSVDGTLDTPALVTKEGSVHYVEIMTDLLEEFDPLADSWFVDCGVVPSAYDAAVDALAVHGLWHLNGKTVSVFAGGYDCGDYLVTNGSLSVSYGDGAQAGTGEGQFTQEFCAGFAGAMPIVVGFTYTSQGQIMRAADQREAGTRFGPGFGKTRRVHQFAALMTQTAMGIKFGTRFTHLRPALFRTKSGRNYTARELFSDIYWASIEDEHGLDGSVCWEISRPLPATICAIGPFAQTQDR